MQEQGMMRRNVPRGEACKNAKLTEDVVREIRGAPGLVKDIAQRYGVGPTTVSDIRTGKAWRHVA